MNESLRNKILSHIASVLKVPSESLNDEMRFGIDIKPSFVSDFKYNELDILIEDMRDACSGKILTEWNRGEINTETVGEYIEHIIRCYNENPKLVTKLIFANDVQ